MRQAACSSRLRRKAEIVFLGAQKAESLSDFVDPILDVNEKVPSSRVPQIRRFIMCRNARLRPKGVHQRYTEARTNQFAWAIVRADNYRRGSLLGLS